MYESHAHSLVFIIVEMENMSFDSEYWSRDDFSWRAIINTELVVSARAYVELRCKHSRRVRWCSSSIGKAQKSHVT